MSVFDDSGRVQFQGNGSVSNRYPIPFQFFVPEDIRVVITAPDGNHRELVRGVDYEVSGDPAAAAGEITTGESWSVNHKVTIYRELPATQTHVYEENADFPAKTHERALDKLTMLIQQVQRRLRQSLRVGEADGELTEVPRRASSLVGFDAERKARSMSADEVAAWLNVSQQFYGQGNVTFLNSTDRNAATPHFLGQIGVQLNTFSVYVSKALVAGAWEPVRADLEDGSVTDEALATNLSFSSKVVSWAVGQIPDGAISALDWAKIINVPANTGMGLTGVYPHLALPSGSVLQRAYAERTDRVSSSSIIPYGVAKPVVSQGLSILSATLPSLAATTSRVRVRFYIPISRPNSTSIRAIVAVFRGGTSESIFTTASYLSTSGLGSFLCGDFDDVPGAVGSVSYSLHLGVDAYHVWINGDSNEAKFAGSMRTNLTLEEIKA